MKATTMDARQVLDALAVRFARPEHFFFRELTFGERRMDAMAVGCYRTHGWEILGFEVKVRRSDWLKELQSPGKSDDLFVRTDQWYLVTPAAQDVAHDGELPPEWGWITVTGRGCSIRKQATRRTAAALDREFMLRLLFRMEDVCREKMEADRSQALDQSLEARKAMRDDLLAEIQRQEQGAPAALAKLQARVQEFEKASGLELRAPYPDTLTDLGSAVRAQLAVRHQVRTSASWIEQEGTRIAESARALLAAVGGRGQAEGRRRRRRGSR